MKEEIKEVEKLMLIEQDLKDIKSVLAKAADEILNQEVSKYPIFIVHKQEIAMGVALVDREKHASHWSVNASTLEEFAVKNLIVDSKIDEFRKTYKNPETHLCIFLLSDIGAQFLFIPR